jgi:hypothetical protein
MPMATKHSWRKKDAWTALAQEEDVKHDSSVVDGAN